MNDSDFRVDAYNPDNHHKSEWKRWRSLADWQQGDVIANVPITWIGPASEDLVTGVSALNPPRQAPAYADDLVSKYALVVTQTCDLMWKPPGDKRPFAQICPVMPADAITNENTRRDALDKKTTYFYPLRIGDKQYVADLRILVPVSKALLLESTRVEASLSDLHRHELGEMLGLVFRRPALPDGVSEDLVKAMSAFINTNRDKTFVTEVEQVRIELWKPRFGGQHARLYVFGRDRLLNDAEQAAWRQNHKEWKGKLKPGGISLEPSSFTTPNECNARRYRRTHPLNLPGLGPSPD